MNFDMLYHPVMEALGAALIHSLWQGALVAIGLVLALRVCKKEDAALRYVLCVIALGLLFVLPVSTGVQVYLSNQADAHFYTVGAETYTGYFNSQPLPVPTESASVPSGPVAPAADTGTSAFAWRPIFSGMWFLGVLLLSVRWMNGLLRVHRLKQKGMPVEDDRIQSAFDGLLVKLGISSRVQLRTTIHVDQPMVIGWLKPVVLLPLSVATHLPPDQVEAILAHELVHVRRHDYFVLVLQSVMEVLFFYHPVVWWVSRQMRIEREYCCDDQAMNVLGNKLVYVTALANLDSHRVSKLALGANDGRLVDRIRRIVLGQQRAVRQRTSWLGIGVLLVGCGLLVTACLDWSAPDLEGTPQELYEIAVEEVKAHNYSVALPYAERAAQQGHMCSMQLLSEMYYADRFNITEFDGNRYLPVNWAFRDEDLSRQWSLAFIDALRKEAEAGNSTAMMWIALAYSNENKWAPFLEVLTQLRWSELTWSDTENTERNDSLAGIWMQRAADADNPYALRRVAVNMAQQDRNAEEVHRLFARAAELGDEAAFFWWSFNNQLDPEKYFEVLDLAVQNEAPGVHELVRNALDQLDRQIELGNEESTRWRAVANTFQFEERLNKIPETPATTPWPEIFKRPCDWDRSWYYYDGGKADWWVSREG